MSTEDRPSPTSRRHLLALSAGFGLLYAATATWGWDVNVDATAAALPGWSVAVNGTLFMDEFTALNPWTVGTPHGWVSNRPPGLIVIAVPGYLIAHADVFTNAPATATAVIIAVAALLVLYLTLVRLVTPRVALAATVVIGAGTSMWQISADALWPHGPGQLWAALGLLSLSGRRYLSAGWAFGAALLTRPITAASTAVIGLNESLKHRSVGPLVRIGAPAGLALALLALYNRLVFGAFSIRGGYTAEVTDRLVSTLLASHAANLVGFFFSPQNGIFLWSPILLVSAVGLVFAWRTIPSWTKSAILGGLFFIVVHARLNRVSGGIPFGYRYPLEAIMLAAPALTLGAVAMWNRSRNGQRVVIAATGLSIVLQLALVLLLECSVIDDVTSCFFTGFG